MATGVQDGASVSFASNWFKNDTHSVKFKIDFENHTDQQLELVDKFKFSGEWAKIPQRISSGKKESSCGRKSSDTGTGKYAVLHTYF